MALKPDNALNVFSLKIGDYSEKERSGKGVKFFLA